MLLLLTSQAFDALSRGSVLSDAPKKGGIVTVSRHTQKRWTGRRYKTRQTWAKLYQARNIILCVDGLTNVVRQSLEIHAHSYGHYSVFAAGLWQMAPPTGSLIKYTQMVVGGPPAASPHDWSALFCWISAWHFMELTPPSLLNSPLQWIRDFIQEPLFDWIISNEQ